MSASSATPPVANPVAPAPASLGRRAGALLYEWLLLTALLFVATFALLPLVSPEPAAVAPSARTPQLPSVPARAFAFLALFAVGALYCVVVLDRRPPHPGDEDLAAAISSAPTARP